MMLKIKYSYISSQVLRGQNVRRFDDEAKQAHLKGEQYKHQVFCQLNHPHKHNILTPQMIQQIHRFLDSYDLDETIRVIWLDCASKGTDFKYLNYLQKPERIEYLRQIQNLAVYFGQYDKILMPVIKGEVSGSMASMVCSTPFQFFEGQSGIRFNDVNRGLIPHGGATFHLSRLPDYLGFYYALTGRWIKRDDALDLDLVYGKLTSRDEATSYLGEMLSEYPEVNTQSQYPYEMAMSVEEYDEGYTQFLEQLSEEMMERMKTEDGQLVAQECFYKLKRFQQENAKVNQIQARISNPYLYFKEWMVDGMENQGFISRVKVPKQNRAIIARCFSAESVDEIMERLRAEQSEDADSILRELEAQPKLSLDLTFKLLKQTENLQWRDCLVTEYNVASNLATSSLFEKQERVQNIDSFFNQVSPKIDYIPNALEPVKDYYKDYPNNIRYFLNEKNLRKGFKDRANQEIDVSAFMISNLHPTDASIRVSDLRKMRLEVDDMKRELKLKLQKLKSVIGYEENLKLYIQERLNYLNSIKDYKTVFEDTLKKFFERANQSRLDAYKNVAQIAVVKSKRELFSLVRNSLLNNKLTQDADDNFDVEKYQKWVRGMNRLLIFPKSDTQSFYENELPEKIVDKENKHYPFLTKAIRRKLFETRYGDQDYDVQQQIEKYYRTVIERITESNKFKNILEYLEGKEVKEILQQLKDDKKEFVVELDPVKQDKNHKEIIEAYKQEFENLKNYNNTEIKNDLSHLFEQNEFLDGIMKIFYECPDQFRPLQNQFEAMLNKAYELRAKKIQPIQNLGAIDEEINQSLILDSFKLIESNLMFSFSYALISDLEEIYNHLKLSGSVDIQVAKIQQLYKIDLQDEELYCEFIYYLNDKLQVATTLYNTYRQKCLLQSDKLLDYLVTLRADRDIDFTSQAIYRNRLHLQMRDNYTNLVDCWDGKFIQKSTLDDLYESIEGADQEDLLDDDIFEDEPNESEYPQIDEKFEIATSQEFEIFDNLQKLKKTTKKQKELIVGLHYYLSRMDLINERQVDVTPDFIKNQKLELDSYLRKKYYQFKPLQQWFEELTQETIAQIYRPDKILTEEQFKKSLYNGFRAEKKLLEELRTQLVLQFENQTDELIQTQKLNDDTPKMDNLIQQLAIAETLKKEGYTGEIDPLDIFSQTKPSIKKYGVEEDQKPTNRRADLKSQLIEDNSKSEKIEQILSKEIDTLFDKIQNLKSQ